MNTGIRPWHRNFPKSWSIERIILEARLLGIRAEIASIERKKK